MPIHDLGYRPWEELTTSPLSRWRVMAEVGVRQAWSIIAVRRSVMLALTPVFLALAVLFIIEQAMVDPRVRANLVTFFSQWPNSSEFVARLVKGETGTRHVLWAYVLMLFLRYPQGLATLILVGVIGPPLISRDVRSRAFLLYFSRPIGQLQYVIGKGAILVSYLLLISVIPALVIFLAGLLLSPTPNVVLDTWDLPLRIVIASSVMIIPSASLMLCLSSLTTESRNAGFAWYVIWVLGAVGYMNLSSVEAAMNSNSPEDFATFSSNWTLISPYHMIGRVQAWIFGMESWDGPQVITSALVLLAMTAVSLAILFRQVSAPLRV